MEPARLIPSVSMKKEGFGSIDSLQLRLLLCVFLIILEGKVKGLVQMLRAWSIAWGGGGGDSPRWEPTASGNAQPWK